MHRVKLLHQTRGSLLQPGQVAPGHSGIIAVINAVEIYHIRIMPYSDFRMPIGKRKAASMNMVTRRHVNPNMKVNDVTDKKAVVDTVGIFVQKYPSV